MVDFPVQRDAPRHMIRVTWYLTFNAVRPSGALFAVGDRSDAEYIVVGSDRTVELFNRRCQDHKHSLVRTLPTLRCKEK